MNVTTCGDMSKYYSCVLLLHSTAASLLDKQLETWHMKARSDKHYTLGQLSCPFNFIQHRCDLHSQAAHLTLNAEAQ